MVQELTGGEAAARQWGRSGGGARASGAGQRDHWGGTRMRGGARSGKLSCLRACLSCGVGRAVRVRESPA